LSINERDRVYTTQIKVIDLQMVREKDRTGSHVKLKLLSVLALIKIADIGATLLLGVIRKVEECE
jgi:hypothetical protein